MEDHHVDRPEVDAEQSVELTGTNRSNPLDPNAVPSQPGKPGPPSACSGKRQRTRQTLPTRHFPSRIRQSRLPDPPKPTGLSGRTVGPRINPDQVGGLKVPGLPDQDRRAKGAPESGDRSPRTPGSLRPRPARQRRTGVSGRFGQPGGHSEGQNTRSHPELGRENPQRRWYCRSSGGRAGRRQARQTPLHPRSPSASPDPSNNAPVPRSSRRRPPNPPPRGGAAR